MATRNRNRTQRKNKNRSRRNRQGGGGSPNSPECAAAKNAVTAAGSSVVKKMAANIKVKQACGGGAMTVKPNQKWSSMGMRSRRNRKHRGGAASISCDEAAAITADPSKYGVVQRMAAKVQMKSCASGSRNTVAPNQKWSSMGM